MHACIRCRIGERNAYKPTYAVHDWMEGAIAVHMSIHAYPHVGDHAHLPVHAQVYAYILAHIQVVCGSVHVWLAILRVRTRTFLFCFYTCTCLYACPHIYTSCVVQNIKIGNFVLKALLCNTEVSQYDIVQIRQIAYHGKALTCKKRFLIVC